MSRHDARHRLRSTLRSLVVGGLSTALDLAALALLVHGAGVSARLAGPVALAAGVLAQFVGNKLFAFEDRSPAWAKQAGLFMGIEAIAFGMNCALFDVAIRTAPDTPILLTRVATQACVYLLFCLPLWGLVFRGPSPRLEGAA